MRVPRYEQQQTSLDVPTVASPKIPIPDISTSSDMQNAKNLELLGKTVGDVTNVLSKAFKQREDAKNEQLVAYNFNNYRLAMQNAELSEEEIEVGEGENKRKIPAGYLNRQRNDADGVTREFDQFWAKTGYEYSNAIKDPVYRAKLEEQIRNDYIGRRQRVIQHESTQLQKNNDLIFKDNMATSEKEASSWINPTLARNGISQAMQNQASWDKTNGVDASVSANNQKAIALKLAQKAVNGTLNVDATGDMGTALTNDLGLEDADKKSILKEFMKAKKENKTFLDEQRLSQQIANESKFIETIVQYGKENKGFDVKQTLLAGLSAMEASGDVRADFAVGARKALERRIDKYDRDLELGKNTESDYYKYQRISNIVNGMKPDGQIMQALSEYGDEKMKVEDFEMVVMAAKKFANADDSFKANFNTVAKDMKQSGMSSASATTNFIKLVENGTPPQDAAIQAEQTEIMNEKASKSKDITLQTQSSILGDKFIKASDVEYKNLITQADSVIGQYLKKSGIDPQQVQKLSEKIIEIASSDKSRGQAIIKMSELLKKNVPEWSQYSEDFERMGNEMIVAEGALEKLQGERDTAIGLSPIESLKEVGKALARSPLVVMPMVESVWQKNLIFLKETARQQLQKDGHTLVFGTPEVNALYDERFLNRDKATQDRINLNLQVFQSLQKAEDNSEWLKQWWMQTAFTGSIAPDPELFKGDFMKNPSWTRAFATTAQSSMPTVLALIVGAATKSSTVGAGLLAEMQASESFVERYRKNGFTGDNVAWYAADLLAYTVTEDMVIAGFLEGGSNIMTRMMKGAAREGVVEEGVQQFWQNFGDKLTIDERRDLSEGVVESIIAGAMSGGVIGALVPGTASKVDNALKKLKDAGVDEKVVNLFIQSIAEEVNNQLPNATQKIMDGPKDNIVKNEDGTHLTIGEPTIEDIDQPDEDEGGSPEGAVLPKPTTPGGVASTLSPEEQPVAEAIKKGITPEKYIEDKLTELHNTISRDATPRNLKLLNDAGIEVSSPDDVITLYHGTSGKSAKGIEKTGINPSSYLASDQNASNMFAGGRGGKVVEIKVRVNDIGFVTPTTMAGTKGITVVTGSRLIKGEDGIWKPVLTGSPDAEIAGIGLPQGTNLRTLYRQVQAKLSTEKQKPDVRFVRDGDAVGKEYHETITAIDNKTGKEVGYVQYVYYKGQNSIRMIEVSPESRRKGIGTALLNEMQTGAKKPFDVVGDVITPEGTALIENYRQVKEKMKGGELSQPQGEGKGEDLPSETGEQAKSALDRLMNEKGEVRVGVDEKSPIEDKGLEEAGISDVSKEDAKLSFGERLMDDMGIFGDWLKRRYKDTVLVHNWIQRVAPELGNKILDELLYARGKQSVIESHFKAMQLLQKKLSPARQKALSDRMFASEYLDQVDVSDLSPVEKEYVKEAGILRSMIRDMMRDEILSSRIGVRISQKEPVYFVRYNLKSGKTSERWLSSNAFINKKRNGKNPTILQTRYRYEVKWFDQKTQQYDMQEIVGSNKEDAYKKAIGAQEEQINKILDDALPIKNWLPHVRQGDFWVHVTEEINGEVVPIWSSTFERKAEADKIAAMIRKQGYDAKSSKRDKRDKYIPTTWSMPDAVMFLISAGVDPTSGDGKKILERYQSMSATFSHMIERQSDKQGGNLQGFDRSLDAINNGMAILANQLAKRNAKGSLKTLYQDINNIKDQDDANIAKRYLDALTTPARWDETGHALELVKSVVYASMLWNSATYTVQNFTEVMWALNGASDIIADPIRLTKAMNSSLTGKWAEMLKLAELNGVINPLLIYDMEKENIVAKTNVLGNMSEHWSSKKAFEIGLKLAKELGYAPEAGYTYATQFFYNKAKPLYNEENAQVWTYRISPDSRTSAVVRKFNFAFLRWFIDMVDKFSVSPAHGKLTKIMTYLAMVGLGGVPWGRELAEKIGIDVQKDPDKMNFMERLALAGVFSAITGISSNFLRFGMKGLASVFDTGRNAKIMLDRIKNASYAWNRYINEGVPAAAIATIANSPLGIGLIGQAMKGGIINKYGERRKYGNKIKVVYLPSDNWETAILTLGLTPFELSETKAQMYNKKKK